VAGNAILTCSRYYARFGSWNCGSHRSGQRDTPGRGARAGGADDSNQYHGADDESFQRHDDSFFFDMVILCSCVVVSQQLDALYSQPPRIGDGKKAKQYVLSNCAHERTWASSSVDSRLPNNLVCSAGTYVHACPIPCKTTPSL
jgi:hypothetical protein